MFSEASKPKKSDRSRATPFPRDSGLVTYYLSLRKLESAWRCSTQELVSFRVVSGYPSNFLEESEQCTQLLAH